MEFLVETDFAVSCLHKFLVFLRKLVDQYLDPAED